MRFFAHPHQKTSTIPDDAIHFVIMNVKVTQYTNQIIAVSLSKDFHGNVFSRMRTKVRFLTCQIIAVTQSLLEITKMDSYIPHRTGILENKTKKKKIFRAFLVRKGFLDFSNFL